MIASGSQYIQLFTSSPDILHLAWGQEKKKQTPSSAPLPAFSRPALAGHGTGLEPDLHLIFLKEAKQC